VYTALASRYGAKENYPTKEKEDKIRDEHIKQYQAQQAEQEPKHESDKTLFSKGLKFIAIAVLAVTLVLASNVMFGSANESDYVKNRELFYYYGFICTIVYFVFAYWALQRGKPKKDVL